jgi:hypothetical protein
LPCPYDSIHAQAPRILEVPARYAVAKSLPLGVDQTGQRLCLSHLSKDSGPVYEAPQLRQLCCSQPLCLRAFQSSRLPVTFTFCPLWPQVLHEAQPTMRAQTQVNAHTQARGQTQRKTTVTAMRKPRPIAQCVAIDRHLRIVLAPCVRAVVGVGLECIFVSVVVQYTCDGKVGCLGRQHKQKRHSTVKFPPLSSVLFGAARLGFAGTA